MKLTKEEVRHISKLARVGMTDDELELMSGQLSNILEHFDVLQKANTEGVDATGHSADVNTVMRRDEPRPSLSRDEVFANAPQHEGEFVRIKAVLE
ncbi:MAG: Asp-tRNA(Asn)/Glu-tRNA(Gln) amidotransferase subunit GatC [SAR202 cluster bacterium]|nr:Asp-tRNA(Asn)/Glu-tRNA(Gln) amidotransferase subunit GatC [SAR202 cluster bacterium]